MTAEGATGRMTQTSSTEKLVGTSEIARAFGIRPSGVTMWRKRYSTFPAPALEAGGRAYWYLSTIQTWYELYGPRSHGPQPRWGSKLILHTIDQHWPSLTDENDDEITAHRYGEVDGIETDNADLAIRTCRCGERIDGFDEYVIHLKEVFSR
jgi:hypothetical protein